MHFYLTDCYLQYAALIITDSAQLLGLTIGKTDMSKLYNIFFRYISHTYMYYIYVTKWLIFVNCVYVNITNCICSKNGKGPFLVLAIRNVKILIIK